jgi:hypothetical protein
MRSQAVIDLLLWSFVLALAPVAIGLSWKLVSAVGHQISEAFMHALRWEDMRPWSLDLPSGPRLSRGRTPCTESGVAWHHIGGEHFGADGWASSRRVK